MHTYSYNEKFIRSLIGRFVSLTNNDIDENISEFGLVVDVEMIYLDQISTALISYITCDATEEKFQIFLKPYTSAIVIKIIT